MKDLYEKERRILSVKEEFKESCPKCFKLVENFVLVYLQITKITKNYINLKFKSLKDKNKVAS